MNISILGYGNLGRSIANGLKSFDNLKKLYVTKKDIENLMAGTKVLIKLLYSAGAESVMLPTKKNINLHIDSVSDIANNIFTFANCGCHLFPVFCSKWWL